MNFGNGITQLLAIAAQTGALAAEPREALLRILPAHLTALLDALKSGGVHRKPKLPKVGAPPRGSS